MFLLLSVLVTGLMISPAFAQDPVNATETMTESNSTSTETMTESSNSTSTGDETMPIADEVTITEDEMVDPEAEMMADDTEIVEAEIIPIPSPLKQIKEGTMPENVVCKEGLGLVFKLNGQPACVKTTSIEKLTAWGWIR